MYYCKNCGTLFSDPRHYIEKHGLDSPPYEQIDVCPFCNISDFSETYECALCGEYITSDYIRLSNGDYVCSNCYTEEEI